MNLSTLDSAFAGYAIATSQGAPIMLVDDAKKIAARLAHEAAGAAAIDMAKRIRRAIYWSHILCPERN